jgi:hypothetical protein
MRTVVTARDPFHRVAHSTRRALGRSARDPHQAMIAHATGYPNEGTAADTGIVARSSARAARGVLLRGVVPGR